MPLQYNLTDLDNSIKKLESYIISEKYMGYDPYDSLMSPLFNLPLLRSNKLIRFGFQQVYRRIPFNTRKLLGIKKGMNPVTLGLCIQAYTYLVNVFPDRKNFYLEEIEKLLDKLIQLQSKGFNGMCWGYDFDWEARYAKIPAFYPTVVATGIITNALFINYEILNNIKSLELCKDAVNFVMKDLIKTYEEDLFCYSYSPNDKQKVINATMMGARLLSQVYSVTKDKNLYIEAKRTIDYVVNNQNENGSWSYAKSDSRKWVDNIHTGYVLDALDDFIRYTNSYYSSLTLEKGFQYYIDNFFYKDEIPKYFENCIYPIDLTAISQSILTLTRFNKIESAKKIAKWTIANMQSRKGYFYFQKTKIYTNKISYMRWSNIWIFTALAYLMYTIKIKND
jgi:hypothetical protein